nr:glycerophosphoryl diester phosphodiesterase membrane domain-containing protein [Paenibacillus larvae]
MKQTSQHPRFFRMTREVIQVWKYSGRSFLLFEFVFKLLTITLFGPFFSVMFHKILALGGFQAVANQDLLRFLISPYGLLSLLILCPFAFVLIYAEFAVLIYLAYYGIQRTRISIKSILLLVVTRFPKLWGLGFIGGAFYLILLFPFSVRGLEHLYYPGFGFPVLLRGNSVKQP